MSMPNEQELKSEVPPNGAAEAEADSPSVESLQAALASAEARAAEHKDLYMRALAELDNVRKRASREIEQAHKFALEKFAQDLIDVKDSLELGLSSAADVEALRSGTEATLKLMSRAFERAGLAEVFPQGEVFNPELHEAIAMQPSAEHVPNTVLQIIQKGYQLNGRLLRPARVIVAREP